MPMSSSSPRATSGPRCPGPSATSLADPRLVAHPWLEGAMDVVRDGGARRAWWGRATRPSTLPRRSSGVTAAVSSTLSRHGDLPFAHEEPWRARLPAPVVTVEEAPAFADPFEGIAERIRAHGEDWRRALDSLRPITQRLWLALDDGLRQRFVRDWRHAWEIRRSRVPPETMRDLDGWRADGRLEIRAGRIERVQAAGERLRIEGASGRRGRSHPAGHRSRRVTLPATRSWPAPSRPACSGRARWASASTRTRSPSGRWTPRGPPRARPTSSARCSRASCGRRRPSRRSGSRRRGSRMALPGELCAAARDRPRASVTARGDPDGVADRA